MQEMNGKWRIPESTKVSQHNHQYKKRLCKWWNPLIWAGVFLELSLL